MFSVFRTKIGTGLKNGHNWRTKQQKNHAQGMKSIEQFQLTCTKVFKDEFVDKSSPPE